MSWGKWIPILEEAVESETARAPAVSQAHRLDHIKRVWSRCRMLGEKLDADLEVLVAATYLHDLGRHHGLEVHGVKSAELAGPILEEIGFPAVKRKTVLDVIASHDYQTPPSKRKTPESRILYDADKLDAFGAVGISRYMLKYFAGKSPNEVDVNSIIEKNLVPKWRGLHLSESRMMGGEDYRYVLDYFKRLKRELGQGKPD